MLRIEETLNGLRALCRELAWAGEEVRVEESLYKDYVADVTIAHCNIEANVDNHGRIHWRDGSDHYAGRAVRGRCDIGEFRVRVIRSLAETHRNSADDIRDQWAELCAGETIDMPAKIKNRVDAADGKADMLEGLVADEPLILDKDQREWLEGVDADGQLSAGMARAFENKGIIIPVDDRYEITDRGRLALEYAGNVTEWEEGM